MPKIRKYKVAIKWPGDSEIFQVLDIEAYDAADAIVQADFIAKKWLRYEGFASKPVHPQVDGIEPLRPTPPLCGKPDWS